jgi:hypothetical protein
LLADYALDHSTFGTGSKTLGTVEVFEVASNELNIKVEIDPGYLLLGVAFTTDDVVKIEPPHPQGWTLDGNGELGKHDVHLPHAGIFGGEFEHVTGELHRDISFDLITNSKVPLSLLANNLDNVFAVQLLKDEHRRHRRHHHDHDHDHDWDKDSDRDKDLDRDKDFDHDKDFRDDDDLGVAWTGPLASPTPLPGALALFGPVLGTGYLFLRRRRRTGERVNPA